jgi:hypothetical protein
MNWNKWCRQIHRWLTIAFTVGVIVNFVAVSRGKYTAWVGFLALLPLAFASLLPTKSPSPRGVPRKPSSG